MGALGGVHIRGEKRFFVHGISRAFDPQKGVFFDMFIRQSFFLKKMFRGVVVVSGRPPRSGVVIIWVPDRRI